MTPELFWVMDLCSQVADLGSRRNLDRDTLVWKAEGENECLVLYWTPYCQDQRCVPGPDEHISRLAQPVSTWARSG